MYWFDEYYRVDYQWTELRLTVETSAGDRYMVHELVEDDLRPWEKDHLKEALLSRMRNQINAWEES
jgi:hypothetical protein